MSDQPHVRNWPKEQFSYLHLKVAKPEEVMDQGPCGSCWAAATTLMLRAHTDIYNRYSKLSLQQLVSCTPNPQSCGGDGGCNGSTGELALDYVMHNGLELESAFPYEARDAPCLPKSRLPRNPRPVPHPSSSK